MVRRANPVNSALGPLAEFAHGLRDLRARKGADAPTIDEISTAERLPRSTLYAALKGDRLPGPQVISALVRAWGGSEADWLARRSELQAMIASSSSARPSQALRDGSTWRSVASSRTVLVVVGTLDSLSQILDVLPLVEADVRVQLIFTIESGSAFEHGLSAALNELGVISVPWHQAATMTVDVVIAAEDSDRLAQLHDPVMVLQRPDEARFLGRFRDARCLSAGLWVVPRPLRSRELIAADEEQRESQLQRRSFIDDYLLVAGDPSFDRMVISVPDRERYRQALRVAAGQRLVVVASSWGRDSLFGLHEDLPLRLLEQLPAEEFRVALVLHPNVWSAHGRWQILGWLREALDLGLLLVQPGSEYAAVVAADVVIGDRGSLTRYAADLGSPTLTVDGFNKTASMTVLGVRHDLHRQVQAVLADAAPVNVTDLHATAQQNAAAIREGIYRALQISEPLTPPQALPLAKPNVVEGKEDRDAVTEEHTAEAAGPNRVMVRPGRRPTISQVGDWVLLAPITNEAKVLYWALQAHVAEPGPGSRAWSTQAWVAGLLDVPEEQVPSYARELEAIDAISVVGEVGEVGETNPGWNYTVHLSPPDGYESASSVPEFQAGRVGRNQVAGGDVEG